MKSNKRKFIQAMGAGAAGFTFGASALSVSSCISSSKKKEEEDGQIIFISDDININFINMSGIWM